MKFIHCLFLICFLTVGILGQSEGRIEGRVVQKSDAVPNFLPDPGETVRDKTVTLVSQDGMKEVAETRTGPEGNFVFENVAAGEYVVFVECSYCWRERVSREVSVAAGQDLKLEIELPRITIEEKVEVSAGTSQPISEVSKTVNIIDSEEIADRNEFSLTDALRTIPGFRLQQLGGFGKTASIKTRGLRNQDTAVLIDGMRFRDASSITGDASAFLSDFVLTDTARVEVLRGSGSSLYGTNAIGGVLDVRTGAAGNDFHGSFSGEGGGLGLKRLNGDLAGPILKDKVFFSFGGARTVFGDGIDGEDDADNTSFKGRIDFQPTDGTRISGRFYFSDAFVRLNSSPDTIGVLPGTNSTIIDAVPLSIAELKRYADGTLVAQLNAGNADFIPDTNDPDNFQKSDFFSGQLSLVQIVATDLVFNASYQGLKTSRENENGVLGVGFQPFGGAETSFFDGQIQTLNAHFDWISSADNQLTAGYEFEWEKFGNDGLTFDSTGNFTTRARQLSHTFYAQDLLGLFGDRLQLAGGVRAQLFRLENPSFSATGAPYENLTLEDPPNAYTFDGSVSYYFRSMGTKLRAHAGNGYRVPSLYERFGTFYSSFSQDFTALGDPGLKPERSIAFDGGIEQNLSGNRVRLAATVFYTRLTDTIGFGNAVPAIGSTPRPFGGYLNTKGGLARGAEFSGRMRATRSTEVFVSYTYTNSDQREAQVAGSGVLRSLGIPDHQFTLSATQRIKGLTLNFDLLATSDYLAPIFSNTTFSTYLYRFEGNRRADLTGSYEIPVRGEKVHLRLFGTIENLFDNDYFENGFRTAGRTARGGLGIRF